MRRLPSKKSTANNRVPVRSERQSLILQLVFGREPAACGELVSPCFWSPNNSAGCVAKACCRFDQRIKNRLKVECRATNDLKHVCGGGLLLQRFPQFVQQPHVFDGDYRLGGEV